METDCENYSVMPELAQPSSAHLLPQISHNLLLPAHKADRDPLLLHFMHSHSRKRTPSTSHTANTANAMAQEVLSGQLPQTAAAHAKGTG